ncbi:glycosyltransferase family 2 protein [Marisediminicola sp. LYQ134]|uniref:glycosyltransferase family 2 protein n=1 Tax=unclassified Marisediminicola TaxID=2618316 RepID=UPI00398377F8
MKLGLTMMVRDEADIIESTVNFYLEQGVDTLVITDNASTDGTTEILQRLADAGSILLEHDPVHRKQQAAVVTSMARRLSTEHGVDWVINADADEFLLPVDRTLDLRAVFEAMPTSIGSFLVPVVNMIGPLVRRGSRLADFVWRDGRTVDELRAVGLQSHPTPNAIHVGAPDVTVAQGNHAASIPNSGGVPAGLELEVLHVPWRAWEQYEHRVDISGAAYLANPSITPSPNHHGMLDFARLRAGVLLPYYAARFPSPDDLEAGSAFTRDDGLLARFGGAADSTSPPVDFPADLVRVLSDSGRALIAREADVATARTELVHARDDLESERIARRELDEVVRTQRAELDALHAELHSLRSRTVVRATDALASRVRKLRPGA